MDLHEAEKLAHELINTPRVQLCGNSLKQLRWSFAFDNAKKRFGQCNYGKLRITLSKHLTQLNDVHRVKNTILHEIAHAIVGSQHGHDEYWRQTALEIGCDGKRCVDGRKANLVKGNYVAICPKCGHVHYRFKKPKAGRSQSCGYCCKSYNPLFKLVWNPNPMI